MNADWTQIGLHWNPSNEEIDAHRKAFISTGTQGDFDDGWRLGIAWAQMMIAAWLMDGKRYEDARIAISGKIEWMSWISAGACIEDGEWKDE